MEPQAPDLPGPGVSPTSSSSGSLVSEDLGMLVLGPEDYDLWETNRARLSPMVGEPVGE